MFQGARQSGRGAPRGSPGRSAGPSSDTSGACTGGWIRIFWSPSRRGCPRRASSSWAPSRQRSRGWPGVRTCISSGRGRTREVPDYIKGFDVGLVPYRLAPYTADVYPTKLNEYLAMGIPVVATDLPAIRRFNAEHGPVVAMGHDADAFAAAIRAAATRARPRHGRRGGSRWRARTAGTSGSPGCCRLVDERLRATRPRHEPSPPGRRGLRLRDSSDDPTLPARSKKKSSREREASASDGESADDSGREPRAPPLLTVSLDRQHEGRGPLTVMVDGLLRRLGRHVTVVVAARVEVSRKPRHAAALDAEEEARARR